MGKIQALALIGLVIGVSAFAWIERHGEVMKWRGKAELADSLLKEEIEVTDGLKKAVASLDTAYAKAVKAHNLSMTKMKGELASLDNVIDKLEHDIALQLGDSGKVMLGRLTAACKNQADLVYSSLVVCEALRKQADERNKQKDNIILRVEKERDGYKDLFDESQALVKTDVWATVGKVETGVGLLALITKLFGLW